MTIYSNAVVERIRVNTTLYGRPKGGLIRSVEIGSDEKIEELLYHKVVNTWWEEALCSLSIKTDANTYHVGGFEKWKAKKPNGRYGYCSTKKYSVKIPKNQDFNAFLDSQIIYGTLGGYGSDWIIGFDGEAEVETSG